MNFAIGRVDYFKEIGFDTSHWRKSLDGTLAVVHYDLVEVLADDNQLDVYRHDDEAFKDVMQSAEWTEQEESTEGE